MSHRYVLVLTYFIQTSYYMLATCGFAEKASLSDINFAAMLIGAAIHDTGHL